MGRIDSRAWLFLAAALAANAGATDVLVAADRADIGWLRTYATQWETATGHRVVWLEQGQDLDTGTADLLVAPAARAWELMARGEVVPLEAQLGNADSPMPALLAGAVTDRNGDWVGVPLPVSLPALRVSRERMAQAGVQVPREETSWTYVFDMAAQISSPIGDVHGICFVGDLHATLIRAMLADAQEPWLDAKAGMPYSGPHWQKQATFYATQLARSGPPNAATLTQDELEDLLARDKCAMWLDPVSKVPSVGVAALAIPGVAAFASGRQKVLAVLSSSDRATVAAELAHSVAHASLAEQLARGPAWEMMLGQAGLATQTWLGSPRRAVPWEEVDRVGATGLGRLVDGLEPVEEALAGIVLELSSVPGDRATDIVN